MNNCGAENQKHNNVGNVGNYVIIIVLYILLAIIIGSWFC